MDKEELKVMVQQEMKETIMKELDSSIIFTYIQKLEQEKEKNKNTGKLVKNKIDGTIGIVLREWETGQIQVLENIQPKVINTYDSWETLELLEEAE